MVSKNTDENSQRLTLAGVFKCFDCEKQVQLYTPREIAKDQEEGTDYRIIHELPICTTFKTIQETNSYEPVNIALTYLELCAKESLMYCPHCKQPMPEWIELSKRSVIAARYSEGYPLLPVSVARLVRQYRTDPSKDSLQFYYRGRQVKMTWTTLLRLHQGETVCVRYVKNTTS